MLSRTHVIRLRVSVESPSCIACEGEQGGVFLGMGVNTFCRVYQVLSYGLLSLFVRTVTIVFGSGPYSLLQWTVRSAVVKHTDYCRSL